VFDAGKECGADANMAASETTWHAAEATSSAYGGFALAKEYDIESANGGRLASTRPRRSRPTSSLPKSASTSSACQGLIDPMAPP